MHTTPSSHASRAEADTIINFASCSSRGFFFVQPGGLVLLLLLLLLLLTPHSGRTRHRHTHGNNLSPLTHARAGL